MNARIDALDAVLRARAHHEIHNSLETCPLRQIWQELTRGCFSVVGTFQDDDHCYLLLKGEGAGPDALNARQLYVLEHVLRGSGQKPIAFDLGVSYSTIATITKRALTCLGVNCIASQTPLSLVVVAQESDRVATVATFEHGGHEYRAVRQARPDAKLSSLLSPAEVQVLRARIEGQTHRKIAVLRRTSMRTVANQLASAARRLGVSGRLETINRLLALS